MKKEEGEVVELLVVTNLLKLWRDTEGLRKKEVCLSKALNLCDIGVMIGDPNQGEGRMIKEDLGMYQWNLMCGIGP